MVFGYTIYTLIIIGLIVILGISLKTTFGRNGISTDNMPGCGVTLILIGYYAFIGFLLWYVITQPHVDIYEAHNNGATTEYIYYNYFKTECVKKTCKTDHYVSGRITSITPEYRYTVKVTITIEDGHKVTYTTDRKVDFNKDLRLMKHYYPTIHYELNGENLY